MKKGALSTVAAVVVSTAVVVPMLLSMTATPAPDRLPRPATQAVAAVMDGLSSVLWRPVARPGEPDPPSPDGPRPESSQPTQLAPSPPPAKAPDGPRPGPPAPPEPTQTVQPGVA